MKKYDAVVIGSGPNGLSAAIKLVKEGLSVKILEAKETTGGGLRTAELTLPGFKHDICSAIHPLAVASPFFRQIPLHDYGLEWIYPPVQLAHPFDDGTAALLYKSIDETAATLGEDESKYKKLFHPLLKDWDKVLWDVLTPLKLPKFINGFLKFGLQAVKSSYYFTGGFKEEKAKTFFTGMAAHSIVDLRDYFTTAVGLVLLLSGHSKGWPMPKGGAQTIAFALERYFKSLGGEIEINRPVKKFSDLPAADFYLFDVTPRQLINICGDKLSSSYKKRLSRFKYGPGVFKIDYALSEPVPWKNKDVFKTATVHIGGTSEEIMNAEASVHKGKIPDNPFVLLAQHTLFDKARAPEGKHTAWVYTHVPHGSIIDMTDKIENQIERFAPGFKDIILAKSRMNSSDYEDYNPNYIGGDINGGLQNWKQLITRPIVSLNPYKTSNGKIYICSSSTPPGGGVHGMCGYNAAEKVLMKIR